MVQNENQNNKKTITGTVEKVIFQDKKSGRSILSVIREDGKPARLIGSISDVEKGDTITAVGSWTKDEKYGWQFIVESILNTLEDENEQEPIEDGLIHALDFSNVLKKSLKAFRYPEEFCDYDVEKHERKIKKNDDAFYSADMTHLIRVSPEVTSFIIPESVVYIGEKAFAGCVNLDYLHIPSSVSYIGQNALDDCKNFLIDRVFCIQWEDVKFRKDYISITAYLGDFHLNLEAEIQGVCEVMNKNKSIIEYIMPNLRVKMKSKDKCEIVDNLLLKEAIYADVTKEIDWKDVLFGDGYINIPTPWGKRINVRDDKIISSLNGIRDYLKGQIHTLRVHFSSFVNAEILNIDELHEISVVLNIKNELHSMIGNPEKLKECSQLLTKHHKLFTPRKRSLYIKYLFENHPFDIYPIVPIIEGEGKSAEKGALFTIMKENIPHIVWENFNDARATYVFPCTDENYEERRQLIFDFIMSIKENKRSYLRTNKCTQIFGQKPLMIVHNDLDSWTQRLIQKESENI